MKTVTAVKKSTDLNPTVQIVKSFFTAFSGALKKLSLYSENHRVYTESLHPLKSILDEFFETSPALRLEIDDNQIRYQDEVIHQGASEPGDLVFILFRDGLKWIEFQPGIELWEIDILLKVIHRYAKLEEDAEDDIVTALWQYGLPSIQYEAVEFSLETDDDLDFSSLKCRPDESDEIRPEAENRLHHTADAALPDLVSLSKNPGLWRLTPEESEQLRKMIAEEEKLDGTDYVIDVLLYILEHQSLPENEKANVLDILIRELREVLVQGRYGYLLEVTSRLKNDSMSRTTDGTFSNEMIESVFNALSGETFLSVLVEIEGEFQNTDPSDLERLKQFLRLLPESALGVLGPLLEQLVSAAGRRMVLETIGVMAQRDFNGFEKLIRSSTPEIAGRMMSILGRMGSERAKQVLRFFLRHELEILREAALKAMLSEEGSSFDDLFKLIEDPDENIRNLLFFRMGQKRDLKNEAMLLEYLEAHDFRFKDHAFFHSLMRTLGKCGSDACLPLLMKQIFLFPSIGVLRPATDRRREAENTLRELETHNSLLLAERVAKGFFRNLFRTP